MTALKMAEQQFAELATNIQKRADELDSSGRAPSSDELKALADLTAQIPGAKDLVDTAAKAEGTLKDAHDFMAKFGGPVKEGVQNAPTQTQGGLPMNTQGKTFGELFVESEQFADFRKRYTTRDGVISDSTKGIQSSTFMADVKTLVTGASDTSGGAFITNDVYAPVTDLIGERELTIAGLVTKGTTDSDTIEYVRITGKTNNAAAVPEATSSGQPATYNSPTGGELTAGGYKPESALALEKVTTTVKTLAHWIPMTKRAASDAGQVRTLVDNFLRYGLNEELEDQIIGGAGTGENFQGILGAGISTVGSAGTDLDAIVDAIRTVRVTGRRRPTAIVMHPNDWYTTGFLLAKDSQGKYLIADPTASVNQLNQLWGLPVVISEAATENTALVGDFRQAVLWQREGITLSVTDSHLDFFTRNLLAILAEMRAGFGILDLQAFCTVTAV